MTMNTRPKPATTRARTQSEWLARQERRRRLTVGGWIAAGVVLVGVLGYLVWREAQPTPRPGEAVPIMGAEHINPGFPHDPYNSDPPTSGPHYEQPAEAGFYGDTPPVDEQLVHNLEHGHVILSYNCTTLSTEECDRLKSQIQEVMGAAGVSSLTRTLKLEGVARPTMDSVVALTAWGRLLKMDTFDRELALEFIRAYRDQGPEPGAP